MKLSPQESARFYRIWWPLLRYVNAQRQIVPELPVEGSISAERAFPIHQALWESDALREAFIAENPAHLPAEDLALVASWRDRVAGNFFIFRHLKQYTVFLTEQRPPRAYGILGLIDPIEKVVMWPPPVWVEAVLLPFEGKIIYDGLLRSYSVHFGGGIRRNLQESYREVQERGGVITTLRPLSAEETRERLQGGNQKVLAAFRKDLAASGLSLKMIERHAGTIATFGDHLLAQRPPRPLLDITIEDAQTYLDRPETADQRVSFKRFVRFLINSGRIDWDEARSLQDLLKRR